MFNIVNAVDFVDLRTLYVQATALEGIAKKHKLKPGQAVMFTNSSLTRFRLVANIRGVIHLVIPGTDEPREYHRYHEVAKLYFGVTRADARSPIEEILEVSERRAGRAAEIEG